LKATVRNAALIAAICMTLGACNTAGGRDRIDLSAASPKAKDSLHAVESGTKMKGHASWYGPGFHGRKTASGERFNSHGMTAAHRTLPFGTRLLVENPENGRSVIVRINDRGPFIKGRSIDLARGAAQTIGLNGVGTVNMTVLAGAGPS